MEALAVTAGSPGSSLYWPTLGVAALHTLEFAAGGLAGALTLGLILALMKVSRVKVLRAVAIFYTEALKNVPLLVVIFVVYFGLPSFHVLLSPLVGGIVALGVYYAAYLSEIFRGGLEGVPRGQYEAACAAGLSTATMYRHIVLPQAIRLALAATGNMVVDLLKGTSLMATIGGAELLTAGQNIVSETFRAMQTYLLVGAIYWLMCFPLSRLVVKYESALKRGTQWSLHRRRLDRRLATLEATAAVGAGGV